MRSGSALRPRRRAVCSAIPLLAGAVLSDRHPDREAGHGRGVVRFSLGIVITPLGSDGMLNLRGYLGIHRRGILLWPLLGDDGDFNVPGVKTNAHQYQMEPDVDQEASKHVFPADRSLCFSGLGLRCRWPARIPGILPDDEIGQLRCPRFRLGRPHRVRQVRMIHCGSFYMVQRTTRRFVWC